MPLGALLRASSRQLTSLKAWQGVQLCGTFNSVVLACIPTKRWASSDGSAGSKAILVPMPKLSPSMTGGTVSKWLKGPGDQLVEYDVLMEIDTETLTEDAYKVDEFAGKVTLLVEAQEDGFIHSILVPEGQSVAVGTPVALMTEYEEDLGTLDDYQTPTDNLYSEGHELRTLTWQSYLKDDKGEGGKGCS